MAPTLIARALQTGDCNHLARTVTPRGGCRSRRYARYGPAEGAVQGLIPLTADPFAHDVRGVGQPAFIGRVVAAMCSGAAVIRPHGAAGRHGSRAAIHTRGGIRIVQRASVATRRRTLPRRRCVRRWRITPHGCWLLAFGGGGARHRRGLENAEYGGEWRGGTRETRRKTVKRRGQAPVSAKTEPVPSPRRPSPWPSPGGRGESGQSTEY